jgi:hypothetical protein
MYTSLISFILVTVVHFTILESNAPKKEAKVHHSAAGQKLDQHREGISALRCVFLGAVRLRQIDFTVVPRRRRSTFFCSIC